LGRVASGGEIDFWLNVLADGAPLEAVQVSLLASGEYRARI
jgi:hypothetical protein